MRQWSGSYNGLSPARRQAIILTNADVYSIGLQGTKFSEVKICIVLLKKMHLKMRKFAAILSRLRCVNRLPAMRAKLDNYTHSIVSLFWALVFDNVFCKRPTGTDLNMLMCQQLIERELPNTSVFPTVGIATILLCICQMKHMIFKTCDIHNEIWTIFVNHKINSRAPFFNSCYHGSNLAALTNLP